MYNVIDTRDLADELDELEARQAEVDAIDAGEEIDSAPHLLDEDETERLAALRDLRDEIGDEFPHGAQMIPVEDFPEFAEDYARDLGLINDDASWPANHIDWEDAADELAQDYTEVEWEGTAYYVR